MITSIDQVHPVGVFAQITSVFGSTDANKKGDDKEAGDGKPETLTAVLYPHRRVRIDELVTQPPPPPGSAPSPLSTVKIVEESEGAEGEVSNFEQDVPSVDSVREELGTAPRETEVEQSKSEESTAETSKGDGEYRLPHVHNTRWLG